MKNILVTLCVLALGCTPRPSASSDPGASSAVASPATSLGTPETRFWHWFEANDRRLFTFEADRDAIFDELSTELHRVHPDLTFEFGPEREGRRDFVISAGGIQAAFPRVESLFASAPTIAHWTFIKFRPRRSRVMNVRFGGAEVAPTNVECELVREGPKIGIVLYFDPAIVAEDSVMKNIGFLFLDEALGEHDVETRVGSVEFSTRDANRRLRTIVELAADFDRFDASHAQ